MKEIRIKLKRGHKEGSILIIGVALVAFLLFLAVPHLFQLSPENKVTDKSSSYSAALSLAEAGVKRAIWEKNYGDISSWKGDSRLRTLTISSIQDPQGNGIGDIEIRVEEPDGENPVVKATGRVAYTESFRGDKTARVVLERTTRVVLNKSGNNWVCSFPKKQIHTPLKERSTI